MSNTAITDLWAIMLITITVLVFALLNERLKNRSTGDLKKELDKLIQQAEQLQDDAATWAGIGQVEYANKLLDAHKIVLQDIQYLTATIERQRPWWRC